MHSFNLTLNFCDGYPVISPVSTVCKINNENLFCDWTGKDFQFFSNFKDFFEIRMFV